MKLVIFGAVALVMGLGGGIGITFLTHKPVPAAGADSTAVAHAAHDSTAPHLAGVAPEPAAPGAAVSQPAEATGAPSTPHDAMPSPAPTSAELVADGPAVLVARAVPFPVPDSLRLRATAESYGEVSRILAKMKTTDAAAIMAHLDDRQVEGILMQLGVRQAAALLAAIPTARAAALSRRIMRRPEPTASATR